MSQREKTLAIIVGTLVALVVNFFLIKFFLTRHGEFQRQLRNAETQIEMLNKQESERSLWQARDEWLNGAMTPVGDPQVAARQLSESVREIAKKHSVIIEAPNPGVVSKQAGYSSLPFRMEAKGEWKSMFKFLDELQAPGQFIVFEQLDLKVDAADKTKLRAAITVAKWFAPDSP